MDYCRKWEMEMKTNGDAGVQIPSRPHLLWKPIFQVRSDLWRPDGGGGLWSLGQDDGSCHRLETR